MRELCGLSRTVLDIDAPSNPWWSVLVLNSFCFSTNFKINFISSFPNPMTSVIFAEALLKSEIYFYLRYERSLTFSNIFSSFFLSLLPHRTWSMPIKITVSTANFDAFEQGKANHCNPPTYAPAFDSRSAGPVVGICVQFSWPVVFDSDTE